MRLFVGCFPPPPIQRAYAAAAAAWTRAPGARATTAEQIHLTLAFLGDQPPEVLDALHAELVAPVAAMPSFVVHGGAATGFPSVARAHVGVIELAAPELDVLAQVVADGVRAGGIDLERRPFRAHATIARFRPARPIEPFEAPSAEWPVTEISVVRSHLGPAGSRYEPLVVLPLARSSGSARSAGSARP